MGIIQKINSWFIKEKTQFEPKPETPEPIKPVIKEVDTSADYGKRVEECTLCKEPIETWQKRKRFGGANVYYHKKCFKATLGLAKQQLGGNQI
jgi:hypothetical protein